MIIEQCLCKYGINHEWGECLSLFKIQILVFCIILYLWQRGRSVSGVVLLGSQQCSNTRLRQPTAHLKYAELHLLHSSKTFQMLQGAGADLDWGLTATHHQCVCPQRDWWASLLGLWSRCTWWGGSPQLCRGGPRTSRPCSSADLQSSQWRGSLGRGREQLSHLLPFRQKMLLQPEEMWYSGLNVSMFHFVQCYFIKIVKTLPFKIDQVLCSS